MPTESEKVIKAAKENVHAGTEIAAKLAHEFVDNLAGRAENLEEGLRQTAHTAEKKVKESLTSVREKSVSLKSSVGEFVQNHPLASIGNAVGLGIALSALSKKDE